MKQFYSDSKLNAVANEVVRYMASFEPFYTNKETLFEYSKRINSYKPNKIYLERQKRFKQKLKEKIERLFNKQERSNMKINIGENQGIVGGVIDHHGILNHPLLLAAHLVSNYYKLLHHDVEGDILTFATGNITLNEQFHRRGFVLNGKKINLFPKEDKNKIIFGLLKYNFDFVSRLKFESHQWHLFTPEEQEFLDKIQNVISNIDFSTCQYLGDQFTKINYHIWPLLFEEKLRKNTARLVSIEYDDVIIDYLVYILQNERDSFIYKMLFDNKFRKKILNEFEGAVGAWNEYGGLGTHFFWGLNDNNKHVRLELKDGYLIGANNTFRVEFTPEIVSKLLLEKKMLPCMLLKFSLILFYIGIKPLAGYSLEYLTRIKTKMIAILEEDFPEDAELVKQIPLDSMNLISICQSKDEQGKLKELYAFDVLYRGGFKEEYFKKLDLRMFKEFMIPPLLFTYDYALAKYGNISEKKNFAITEADLQKTLKNIF